MEATEREKDWLAQSERRQYEIQQTLQQKKIQELQSELLRSGKDQESLKSNQVLLFTRLESVLKELNTSKDQLNESKRQFQETVAKLQNDNARLEQSKVDSEERSRVATIEMQRELHELRAASQEFDQIRANFERELDHFKKELVAKQNDILTQEQEISELRADKGHKRDASHLDQDRLEEIIAEQLRDIGNLELVISEKDKRLQRLESDAKIVEILQEEKDSLKREISELKEAQTRLGAQEAELLDLRNQQNQWKSYLEQNTSLQEKGLDSPVKVVRELMYQHVESTKLRETVAKLEEELKQYTFSDNVRRELNSIEADKLELQEQLTYAKDEIARLKRENELQTKELGLYREPASKGVDSSDSTKDTQEMEQLVAKYKAEAETLRKQLAERENAIVSESPLRKKSRLLVEPSVGEEEKKQLVEKLCAAQSELSAQTIKLTQLQHELTVVKQQVSETHATKHRILELRSNPTAKHEAVKQAQLALLQQENEDLLRGRGEVPTSTLERTRQTTQIVEQRLHDSEKRNARLKEVFGKKSLEFLKIVNDMLGYKVEPQQNKKVRLIPFGCPDQSLVINQMLENEYRGLEPGPLATELENHATFWLKERNSIPCFLAAVTLELYERSK